MKRVTSIVALLSIMAFLSLAFVATAPAKELMLQAPIASAMTKLDKNGNEYVRLIVNESKNLDGVHYTVGTPVMCFGQTVAKAKALSEGDEFKAIVDSRYYKGRKSYTLIAFPE